MTVQAMRLIYVTLGVEYLYLHIPHTQRAELIGCKGAGLTMIEINGNVVER